MRLDCTFPPLAHSSECRRTGGCSFPEPLVGVIDGFRWAVLRGTTDFYWPGWRCRVPSRSSARDRAVYFRRPSAGSRMYLGGHHRPGRRSTQPKTRKQYLCGHRMAGYYTLREKSVNSCAASLPRTSGAGARAERSRNSGRCATCPCSQPGEFVGLIGRNGAGKSRCSDHQSHHRTDRGQAADSRTRRKPARSRHGLSSRRPPGEHSSTAQSRHAESRDSRQIRRNSRVCEVAQFLDTPVKRYSSACMCDSRSPSRRISSRIS